MDEWISVKDRLPEYGTQILVCFKTLVGKLQYTTVDYVNQKTCAHSEKRVPTWWVTVSGGHHLTRVTHWQPLPNPPKESL